MNKMVITEEILDKFLEIIDEYNEFIFGDRDYIKKQLETVLNSQGYWSGCSINIYYDKDLKEFYAKSRF